MDVKTIFKPHYNNYQYNEIEEDVLHCINNSKNLIYFKDIQITELNELLTVSDFLITDYSSVFVDYLLLQRPILFVDVPTRWAGYELTEYLINENISITKTFDAFKKSFNNIFKNDAERLNLNKFCNKVYGSIVQEDTVNNYKSDIADLLEEQVSEI